AWRAWTGRSGFRHGAFGLAFFSFFSFLLVMAHPTPLHNNAAAARSSSTASQWLLHRLGMLPVLVVLYLLFYALTIYL
ncbi:hypothetical protein ABTE34_21850, partial [Acinetobacter baumannii]